ncbi:CRTAC1 family protein [Candidatus Leptofilum sp.]|uniref:CRTAC1 family protein n=1 Tax=Candidatus Leptofilum sp. TaxID=3241576 RepID=UPI003B595BE1
MGADVGCWPDHYGADIHSGYSDPQAFCWRLDNGGCEVRERGRIAYCVLRKGFLGVLLGVFGWLGTAVLQAQSTTPDPFVDVTAAVGIAAEHTAVWDYEDEQGYLGVGQAWGDYDNDGWLDLYVTGNQADNVLYHNQQDGTFAESPLSPVLSLPQTLSGGAIWADYDNDGWQDLYVLVKGANRLFHNDAGSGFTDVTGTAGVGDTGTGESAAWGDYDNDGFLDLYVVNWTCEPNCDPIDFNQHQDKLYRNNGDGTFSDVSDSLVYDKLLGAGFAASFIDYDNDQDFDIYVINDEYQNPIGNVLFRNDGAGCGGWCWTDVSAVSGADVVLSGMGIAVADYDNDADLDMYFSNMLNAFSLLQNQGDGTFTDQAEAAGVHFGWTNTVGWGTGFLDYDNDGWQDLFLAATGFVQRDLNVDPEGMMFSHPNYLFANNRDGSFTDVWAGSKMPSMGFAYADYDNDGWMDYVVGNWNEGYRLFRNNGFVLGNWLTIDLTGGGSVNMDAVGTRVVVTTTDGRFQTKTVTCGGSLGAGHDMRLHFGLGQAEIDSVEIVWPDGETVVFNEVASNQLWQVTYGDQEAGGLGGTAVIVAGVLIVLAVAGLLLARRWMAKV